jgi:hypothetical protein
LTAGTARLAALIEWVRQGGELVLFVGAEADVALAVGAPLADLAPARFGGMYDLRQTSSLEVFAESATQVPMEGSTLGVPRLVDVRGVIVAYDGPTPNELPLVIRRPYGFGRVTLAAIDLDAVPIARWSGRGAFVNAVLGRRQVDVSEETPYYYGGQNDISLALSSALDEFTDVQIVPFFLVAMLVLLYILLIGPGDYILVRWVFKRMEMTWITFPAIVIVVSTGAYWFAYWVKGDKLRVNQIELVDVDVASGEARGLFWSHVFSPRSDSYNLSLAPVGPGDAVVRDPRVQLSWMGRSINPYSGISVGNTGGSPFARPYAVSPDLSEIAAAPISMWSSKSILGRWSGSVAPPLAADLRATTDQMLAGELTNQSSARLTRVRLHYDRWVYDLRDIAPGETVDLSTVANPKLIKTWLTGETQAVDVYSLGYERYPIRDLVNRMSFEKAAKADADDKQESPENRYRSFCDLSDMLTMGRAVLIADVPSGETTRLVRDGEPLGLTDDQRRTILRFLIPVESAP